LQIWSQNVCGDLLFLLT